MIILKSLPLAGQKLLVFIVIRAIVVEERPSTNSG